MANNRFRYKPPESKASDKRTPVTFYGPARDGFFPGQRDRGEKLFFCMAEMYQSSLKDYDALDTTNIKFAMTLILPNPYPDYVPENTHTFKVENPLYEDIEFNVETIAPQGVQEIKVVGAAYG